MTSTFPSDEPALVDPDSTDSESTAPSTESPSPSEAESDTETTGTPSSHDPNVTWGEDDPDRPSD